MFYCGKFKPFLYYSQYLTHDIKMFGMINDPGSTLSLPSQTETCHVIIPNMDLNILVTVVTAWYSISIHLELNFKCNKQSKFCSRQPRCRMRWYCECNLILGDHGRGNFCLLYTSDAADE